MTDDRIMAAAYQALEDHCVASGGTGDDTELLESIVAAVAPLIRSVTVATLRARIEAMRTNGPLDADVWEADIVRAHNAVVDEVLAVIEQLIRDGSMA